MFEVMKTTEKKGDETCKVQHKEKHCVLASGGM